MALLAVTVSTPVLVALIAASAPTLAIFASSIATRRKLEQVHILVNDRMSKAMEKIASLEDRLEDRAMIARLVVKTASDIESARKLEASEVAGLAVATAADLAAKTKQTASELAEEGV